MDIGVNLVYSYFRYVKRCALILPDARVGEAHGSLDIIAVDRPSEKVFLSDIVVEFGETLPHIYEEAEAGLEAKIRAAVAHAKDFFPTMAPVYILWSPTMRRPIVERLGALQGRLAVDAIDFDLVANDDFAGRIRELLQRAMTDGTPSSDPAFRLLQILERAQIKLGASLGGSGGGAPRVERVRPGRGFACQFTVIDWTPHIESYSPRARDLPACKLKIDTLRWERAKDFREINCPFAQNQRECNLFQLKRR